MQCSGLVFATRRGTLAGRVLACRHFPTKAEVRMVARFSERMIRLVSDHEKLFPEIAGFISALSDARNTVELLPPEFSFVFHLKPTPTAMGNNAAVVFPRLLQEVKNWLGFIVHSVRSRRVLACALAQGAGHRGACDPCRERSCITRAPACQNGSSRHRALETRLSWMAQRRA